jgi:hypothetical protein
MSDESRYAAAGRRLRIARLVVLGLPLPAVVVGRLNWGNWGDRDLARAAAAALLVAFVLAAAGLALFRCPRCRRFFCWSRRTVRPLSRSCVHCGLAI